MHVNMTYSSAGRFHLTVVKVITEVERHVCYIIVTYTAGRWQVKAK